MSYQVLARKWRPQDFTALVGQESIVTALRNALRDDRVAQAYLFSGIRGVGKTTTARVLAKALNCERGPAEDPCNECRSCTEIAAGADLDVIEVDAATYSKVEQVRELTESLKYGPARDRYKVVVIDEIHRLSRQAFDALLKIVEEPPAHLTFVFATTEIEAVPATILSRCQEFHFRRVPAETLTAYLQEMASSESIDASDTALRLIARAGDGSVRDSVALLDQLATFGNSVISDEDAVRLLGGLDTALFEEVLENILAGNGPSVSSAVRRIEDEGWDPRNVYAQFLRFCRDALHLAQGADPSLIDLPRDQTVALGEMARASGFENLLRLLNQLLQSEALVRSSDAGTLALEIAWLRAAELPKLTRIEDLLAGTPEGPGSKGAEAKKSASGKSGPKATPSRAQASAAKAIAVAAPAENETPGHEKPGALEIDQLEPSAEELRRRVGARSQSLGAHLASAQQVEIDGSTVRIVLQPGDQLTHDALSRDRNRKILDAVVKELWGNSAQWGTLLSKKAKTKRAASARPPGAEPEQTTSPGPADSALEHPTVQKVLDIFGGSVDSVEPRPSSEAEAEES